MKQRELKEKINKLDYADEEYYLTSEYLLKLASNAGKVFVSSEAHEKRLLLKMTLQNLRLEDRIVRYDWLNPFDKIANLASRQLWLQLKIWKKKVIEIFKFLKGSGRLPTDFEDIYVCDVLGITYTELEKQPSDWVDKMILWKNQKAKVEEMEMKRKQVKMPKRRI